MSDNITLYGYWRSSAAYRVRICLNLKELKYESKSVHLVRNGGEQHSAEYHELNASELVPVLVDGDIQLNQSLAIIQYLDEQYPTSSSCSRAIATSLPSFGYGSGYRDGDPPTQ